MAERTKEQKDSDLAILERRNYFAHCNEWELTPYLHEYILKTEELLDLGYPMELITERGNAYINKKYQHPLKPKAYQSLQHSYSNEHQQAQSETCHLDVNAREFVPGSWTASYTDSGNSSPSSHSLESSDLELESASDSDQCDLSHARQRRCARCCKMFQVSLFDGEYLVQEKCHYHWGKLIGHEPFSRYECCHGRDTARGCTTTHAHVWSGLTLGMNGPYYDFVRTQRAPYPSYNGGYGIYAIDCEMIFTKNGLELGKVSVVALDGSLVYEALVRPEAEVIDYNTRFSGLRAKDLEYASKTVYDVQRDLLSFVSAETILIGHSMDNDLRALRILHSNVIDTCKIYEHKLGLPYRTSLRALARFHLKIDIQIKEHDSAEDARTTMDLVLYKLHKDLF